MANGASDSITPFFTIWTEPRATIRRIVDTDPKRYVIALAAGGSAISALAGQWSIALNTNANLSALWPVAVAFRVVIAAIAGIIGLYLGAAMWRWSGGLLGGVASSVEVRAALAWSSIPALTGSVILLFAALSGVPIPTKPGLLHLGASTSRLMLMEAVLGFWGFILSLKCIGEVHRFSAWRALLAGLIPAILVVVIVGLSVLVIVALLHQH